MKVLLSIKPQFADRIFDGSKGYEFRKAIFKNPDIRTVVVYASSPKQMVIGEFEIDSILSDSPERLWEQTKGSAGVESDYFFEYFSERKKGFAIVVKNPKLYKKPLCLRKHFRKIPPQSFLYLE